MKLYYRLAAGAALGAIALTGAAPAGAKARKHSPVHRHAVDPRDAEGFVAAAGRLAADAALRARLAASARAYAERTFDIARIGDLFENVLLRALDLSTEPAKAPSQNIAQGAE